MRWLAEATKQGLAGERAPIFISLARVPGGTDAPVDLTPERLFGRHCAVLGATGGGKSWTLARMLEELSQYGSKIVLIDATGEFYTLTTAVKHLYIGQQADLAVGASEVVFPHSELTESDLSSLFKPSGQVQAPKLRAAMKSLKLAKLEPQLATNGVIDKVQKAKKPYDTAYQKWIKSIESPRAEFEVSKLTQQINAECVWPSAGTQTAPNYALFSELAARASLDSTHRTAPRTTSAPAR